jgi:hypothetical protein
LFLNVILSCTTLDPLTHEFGAPFLAVVMDDVTRLELPTSWAMRSQNFAWSASELSYSLNNYTGRRTINPQPEKDRTRPSRTLLMAHGRTEHTHCALQDRPGGLRWERGRPGPGTVISGWSRDIVTSPAMLKFPPYLPNLWHFKSLSVPMMCLEFLLMFTLSIAK